MPETSAVNVARIRKWVRNAGRIALSQFARPQFQIKSDRTVVTQTDRLVESYLLKRIIQNYPGHGVLAEEGGMYPGRDFLWIIDPIDGTRAYVSGLPVWGISLGVFHKNIPLVGAFYMPLTGALYWGTLTEAYHNRRHLSPRSGANLQSPLAFLAVPSNAHLQFDISFPRLRSLGSTAAHLAYVAHGIATAALTRPVRIWDIAALLPILRATGISLLYLDGEEFNPTDLLDGNLSRAPLVAARTSIMADILAAIRYKSGTK